MKRSKITIALHAEIDKTSPAFPEDIFDVKWYRKLLTDLPACIEGAPSFSLSIILVGEDRIRELNASYRNISRVTDVLSFAYHEKGILESGEIYLCPAQAVRQRSRFHTTKKQDCARLFFHGLLHILGFDHDVPASRRQMRALEDCLMQKARVRNLW